MSEPLTTPEAMLEKIVELLEQIVENTTPAEAPADEEP
jgi:hypothetical protein